MASGRDIMQKPGKHRAEWFEVLAQG